MCFIVTKSRLKYNKTPDDLAKALQGEVPADQTLKHNTVNFLHQECTRLHSSGGVFIKLTLYIIFRGYCCIELMLKCWVFTILLHITMATDCI